MKTFTGRMQVEEGLRVAEMRYRSFYEKSRDALMTLDPSSGLFTSANPSAIAMFGARDEADFVSRALWQYSSVRQPNGRDSAELAKETIETAVRDGYRCIEWTCAKIDGTEFPATILLIRFECAAETILQATVRETTLEKQAEVERETRLPRQVGISLLQQSLPTPAPLGQKLDSVTDPAERFASSIVDPLSAHVAILDETGTIMAVNRAWREFAEANPSMATNAFEARQLPAGVRHGRWPLFRRSRVACRRHSHRHAGPAAELFARVSLPLSPRETLVHRPCHVFSGRRLHSNCGGA